MTNRRSREFSLFLPVTVLPAQKLVEVPLSSDSTTSDAISFCIESLKLMANSSYTLVGDFGGFEKYFEPEERLFNLVKKQIVTAGDNVKFFLRKKKAKQNETVEKSVTFDAFPRDSTHCDTLKSKSSTTGEFQKYRHISDLVQSILDENFNDISFDSSSLKQEHLHNSDVLSEAAVKQSLFEQEQLRSVDERSKAKDPHSPATPTTDRKKVTLGLSVMPSFEELCELVEQQKRLIGANNSAIDAKELKLRSLKQSEAATTHKALSERLKVLRDRVGGEEAQLAKLKQLRSDLEWDRKISVQSDAELLVLRQELLSKEEQLQKAGDRVAELTKQLTEVRKLPHGKRLESESDSFKKYTKLKEEVALKKKMNADGLSRLKEQLSLLSRRQSELMAIDQRVGLLAKRVSDQRFANDNNSESNAISNASRNIGRLTPIESHLRTLDRLTVVSPTPTPPVMPPPSLVPSTTSFLRRNDMVVDQKPRASVGPFKPTVVESSSSGDESPIAKPDNLDQSDKAWPKNDGKISSMERLTSPLTVQNVQAEIQKDVKTAGFKTAFMAMQETLEDVVKPKTQKPSSHYASGLSTSLRLSAPLASTESSDISNIGITNKSLTEAEISRNATASPAVHLFTQVPSIGSSMPTRLSPNSSGLTVEGVKSGKPLTSTDSITATNNGVTTARLTSKEITNVYTRVDPPHIPTALADYKRRIQRMKEESKLGLKSSVSAGNMDAYRNVLPIYAKTGRLEPIADGSGQTEPIKMDTHPNPPDIIPPEERLGVHLRQNPIDLRLGDTKGQLFYTNVVPSGRVPEPDVLHIRADTLRAAKRRSWAATEHSNNSGNSEADNIRWLLHQEQLKGRTNVNLSELFAKLSKPEGQQTTSAAVELSEISVPSARRGSYRSATDEKSDLLAPIELSESVRNDSLAPTNQRGRNWSADTPDLELDQQEMIERQQPEENSIEDEGFTEFIDESTQPVTCIDSNSQSVLNPSDQATHIDIDPDRPDSQIAVVFPPATKGILKPRDAESKGIRIRFDPMALLLDASLEGELELVKTSAMQVKNVSASNDEGITALHNAICAGHYEIVRFLVESDADVNAQDSDGWTPLHCAASCNNLPMVKFLVENGGCIFATTISDHETPADKCEEDEDGFDGCSQFLISIQDKLGIMNGGRVFAAYDFEPCQSDELKMIDGDELLVLKRDETSGQRGWWLAKNIRTTQEGLVPRNYLALYARRSAQKRHVTKLSSTDELSDSQKLKGESPVPLKQHLIEGLECFEETVS